MFGWQRSNQLLDRIATLTRERDKAIDAQKAERRLCGEYDKALDEAMESIQKHKRVIEEQAAQIKAYQALINAKVMPIAKELHDWSRGQQHSLIGGDEQC